ncbi:hypothetical protein PHJA_000327500 [Phtheirospermum japonicum]|uniref:Uncharacterized protein n=1 Tax=Phtheirospermum japonicum TaxID=374723 RepID=A0A830B7Q0_9LAMI|nr:hypothetical protein PHJA_000327500 [Phtheirospermum japonicum]
MYVASAGSSYRMLSEGFYGKAMIVDLKDVDMVEELHRRGFDGEFQLQQANPQFKEISWAFCELGIEPEIV